MHRETLHRLSWRNWNSGVFTAEPCFCQRGVNVIARASSTNGGEYVDPGVFWPICS